MIKTILNENPDLRGDLFIRGFLVTGNEPIPCDGFPLYGSWKHHVFGKLHFYTHPLTGFHILEKGERCFFLLGHAYNPFTMEFREETILQRLGEHYGKVDWLDCVDELTGIFLLGTAEGDQVEFLVDPAGIQSSCCGFVDGRFCLTSHPQLAADLFGLEMDSFVRRLVAYKWYPRVMGAYLPADLTPFAQLKRVVPNQSYLCSLEEKTVKHKRFYPLKELPECADEEQYQQTIEAAADILRRNMELVTKKWENPWISLTGGIDSNTTFAAANGVYDRVKTFSYLSAHKESIDCDAAKVISERFQVPWTLYRIPEDAGELDRFAQRAAILRHNNGYIACEKDNELRKRVVLRDSFHGDVEVKSWVSETIRGYWYKHYGRKTMPKLSGKLYRNLYKMFLTDRALAHEIDKIFSRYLSEYEYDRAPDQYPPADLHFNEVTWGSWGSLNISEMKYCFDITIIYNNRRFLDLLFKVPLERRISDRHHLDMKKYLNPELYDMGIRVVNMHETKFRAFALNVIFTINSILPF